MSERICIRELRDTLVRAVRRCSGDNEVWVEVRSTSGVAVVKATVMVVDKSC